MSLFGKSWDLRIERVPDGITVALKSSTWVDEPSGMREMRDSKTSSRSLHQKISK